MNGPRPSPRPWLPDLIGLLTLVVLATGPFLTPHADMALQRLFYTPEALHPWSHEQDALWRWLYRFGPWPALLVAVGALGMLTASRWRPMLARWRPHALFLVLALALGPGLLVNVFFKDHWGRPRPRQTVELGGAWPYQSFLQPGIGGRGKSFPCGHSSMGYYFVVFYFLWRRRHPARAAAALAFAAAYGTLIGAARMAAGGHFASDVAWSAVMTAVVAYVLYYGVLRVPQAEARFESGAAPPPAPRWLIAAVPVLAAFAVAMGLLGTPYYREFELDLPASSPAVLSLDVNRTDVELRCGDEPASVVRIRGEVQGFGWPGSRVDFKGTSGFRDGEPSLDIRIVPWGWFGELNGNLVVTLPPRGASRVTGRVARGDLNVKAEQPDLLPAIDVLVESGTATVPPEAAASLTRSTEPDGTRVRLGP